MAKKPLNLANQMYYDNLACILENAVESQDKWLAVNSYNAMGALEKLFADEIEPNKYSLDFLEKLMKLFK